MNREELIKGAKLQRSAQKVLIKQLEQTHLSAKMSAMKILVDYYNNQISDPKNPNEVVAKAKAKRKHIISQIDELIDGIDDSSVD